MRNLGWKWRLKGIEGRKPATDEEILKLLKMGWFLHQIKNHYKVGLKRLRRIARAYEGSPDWEGAAAPL